jgi:hypothetical protein
MKEEWKTFRKKTKEGSVKEETSKWKVENWNTVLLLFTKYYKVSKSRRLRWAGHVARMGEKINT